MQWAGNVVSGRSTCSRSRPRFAFEIRHNLLNLYILLLSIGPVALNTRSSADNCGINSVPNPWDLNGGNNIAEFLPPLFKPDEILPLKRRPNRLSWMGVCVDTMIFSAVSTRNNNNAIPQIHFQWLINTGFRCSHPFSWLHCLLAWILPRVFCNFPNGHISRTTKTALVDMVQLRGSQLRRWRRASSG